jgi:hypothetical protein
METLGSLLPDRGPAQENLSIRFRKNRSLLKTWSSPKTGMKLIGLRELVSVFPGISSEEMARDFLIPLPPLFLDGLEKFDLMIFDSPVDVRHRR